jgi:predicted HAD superfamily phosphohydrolase YqeG
MSYLRHGRTAHSLRIGSRVERLAVPIGWLGRWHLLVRLDDTLLPYDVADDEGEAVRWVVEG